VHLFSFLELLHRLFSQIAFFRSHRLLARLLWGVANAGWWTGGRLLGWLAGWLGIKTFVFPLHFITIPFTSFIGMAMTWRGVAWRG